MLTTIRGRLPAWRALGAILVALTLIAGACGDDDAASSSFQDVADGLPAGAGGTGDEGGGSDSGGDTGSEASVTTDGDTPAEARQDERGGGTNVTQVDTDPTAADDFGRSIIRVAEAVVEVEDVPAASLTLQNAMARLGAVVFNETTNTGRQSSTTLEFRMRPADFQEALGLLKGAGELVRQTITSDDVTDRLTDLDSRIATAEVSVERLRGFLEEATNLTDIASLEQQLLERENALELLRGQQRTIADHVALATVIVTLREPSPPEIEALAELAVTAYSGDDGGAGCPGFDQLRIDEGDPVTVCVTIENTGTSPLSRFDVTDHGLDLDRRDFTFEGVADLRDLVLAPGETIVGWATTDAPSTGGSNVDIYAVAVDEEGESLRVPATIEQYDPLELRFVPDETLPGFVDGLKASAGVVAAIVMLLILLAGAAIPFLWVPLVAWLAWRWWSPRRAGRIDDRPAPPASPMPPGPLPGGTS